MSGRAVVAGTASLCLSVPVQEFPVPEGPTRFSEQMGAGVSGVGANVAAVLHRLGTGVELCTVVGEDPAGELIRADLRSRGLLGPGAVTGPGSSLALSLVCADGGRAGYSRLDRVERDPYPAQVFERLAGEADLAVLTTAAFVRPLAEQAFGLGIPVAVDVHLIADLYEEAHRPWLNSADIVFCSHERLPCPPREWIARVFGAYPGCAIAAVGCGAEGALLGTREGLLVQAGTAPPRPVRGTVGAGDTLFASFLHGWLAAGNPVEALRDAVLHAAWKVGDPFPGAGHLNGAELAELSGRHPVRVSVRRWR